MKHTNALIHEHSLYLQQHAHNPVNWVAWSTDAFETAKRENKLVLVSVGYSACHWCHVMEHECFEDQEVAALMNKHFVCIKVDREERPDVDGVYMSAVQLMTQRGGWPLNCFTLADGKPIYGGTYFPKEQWMHILKSLQQTVEKDPEKVMEYAMELTNGVAKSELISKAETIKEFPEDKLPELVRRWLPKMDSSEGGPTHAPKFPLPSNHEFLLYYSNITGHEYLKQQVDLTLHKMAFGGIYDQVGGGFSRYSVDMLWKIPHFEKMLYDNGQLLGLYANAYRIDGEPEYKRILYGILHWLEREMTSEEGGLFAAQDADSEGEEGKYYVWSQEELKVILGNKLEWFNELFNPENKGYWEHNSWVLLRNETWETFLKRHPELTEKDIQSCLDDLFSERKRRIAPGTDTKCLTAWNAMTISGLISSYRATEDEAFLKMALQIGRWIVNYQFQPNGRLWHTRQNKSSFIDGFLDDYAFVIEAFLNLYQVTSDQNWLEKAIDLERITKELFFHEDSGMYYFSSVNTELIARKMELNDNVIPATNSTMAHNLLTLAQLSNRYELELASKQMLQNMLEGMEQYGSGYSNWALLLLRYQEGLSCIHVPKDKNSKELQSILSPFVCVQFTEENTYSICSGTECSLPIDTLEDVIKNM